MTLVASCITWKWAIQVSDRRLTRMHDGRVVSDDTSKAVQYWNQAAFAYSGPAKIGDERTDTWLTRILAKYDELDLAMLMVQKEAQVALDGLRLGGAGKRLAFHGVGWIQLTEGSPELAPVFLCLSNAHNEHGEWIAEARPSFELQAVSLRASTPFKLMLLGAPVVDADRSRATKLIRKAVSHNAAPWDIIRILAALIRETARKQGTVGAELLAAIVPPDSVRSNTVGIWMPPEPIREPRPKRPTFWALPSQGFAGRFDLPMFASTNLVMLGGSVSP